MALSDHEVALIGDDSLQDWKEIGFGGFGKVYRARHKDWADVAIKTLFHGDGAVEALLREANLMNEASSPNVLRVYGIYRGYPPSRDASLQLGIVMELMEKGSLHTMQKALNVPPPLPLVFRLAKQVALGMNFLHKMKPPLLHQDLKPNNVLLDDDLNAKITDFGLARVSTSVLRASRSAGVEGGTASYTPPEAFSLNYKPVRSYDIYSYGILLWSIITGKEPYPAEAEYSRVAVMIREGDRPLISEIDQKVEGLGELVDLMQRCWNKEPNERPPFEVCHEVTEREFSKHKKGIRDAVYQVLSIMEPDINHQSSTSGLGPFPTPTPDPRIPPTDPPLQPPKPSHPPQEATPSLPPQPTKAAQPKDTAESSNQDSVDAATKEWSDADKAKFVDAKKSKLTQEIGMVMAIVDSLEIKVHREAYEMIDSGKTPQEQIRVLYRKVLLPGGVKAKAAFYNAIRENEPDLLERLGG